MPEDEVQPQPLNSSFSLINPMLQIAWDSTSLGALKTCPRSYQYSIIEGWAPRSESVHLTFGQIYHSALEAYDHCKAAGGSHEDGQRQALLTAMVQSWDLKAGRPWASEDKYKNRETLIRTVIWYLEQFENDPFTTVQLANGRPAVELSFRMQTGFQATTGEEFLMCGHLDRVASKDDETFILDRKTSKSAIDQNFVEKFSPDNQFSTYILAGNIVLSLPVKAIVVDGAQIQITGSRFQRGLVYRHQTQLQEFLKDWGIWTAQAEVFAKMNYWPMNDKSCSNYGGCAFRPICSKPPASRGEWLKAQYTKRMWDPLQVRGDV